MLVATAICLAATLPQAARSDRAGRSADIDAGPAAERRMDFTSALKASLLVLPVPRETLDAAPTFHEGRQREAVDAYWAAHPPLAMN
jgi:hypothetical protein